jgi:hypothetical protein
MYDGPPGASDELLAKTERARFLDREAAKVYLLLDFLSGRAEQSLRPTQEEQARILIDRQNRTGSTDGDGVDEKPRAEIEADLYDPTRLVLRAMRINNPIAPSDQTFHADATFLMRARDMLNARARPATDATIAFTSLVLAHSPSGPPDTVYTAQFAQRAHPECRQCAVALARSIKRTLRVLLVVLLAALSVSAYTAWGKVMMDTLDAVRRDAGATPNPSPAVQTDINERYMVTLYQIATWEWPIRLVSVTLDQEGVPLEQKHTAQWATAALTVLGNYIMPILYGLLGSAAFVLRRHYDRLAENVLSPRDLRANSIRLGLGVLMGGCIGLVYSGSAAAQTTGILGAAATLSTAAIAFLAGYGVEGVFKALDGLISQVFRVNGTDKPPRAAA